MLYDFAGPDYGVVTPQAVAAITLVQDTQQVQLDTTYTGKACAGMLHEIETKKYDGQTILFWNTFCAQVPQPTVQQQDLSPAFQQFFVS
jgi:1-aminocyclopropane-1-carboxylate deaminase/D-cysteine desulfhydrase-like pyridoxal-dependent ACC family enzyme